MNKQSKWIMFLVVLLVIAGTFIITNIVKGHCDAKVDNAYQQGFNDYGIALNNKIINEINNYGFVVFNVIQNNQTIPIKMEVI